ncbi:MAG: hypothetical protein A4E71_00187 [Smithella sp. PtaU1.Bin162]|nr:MAG: hypothetical protein A4E71_00187 [Smithella sp. PtaU1.Bin162]
MRKKQDSPVQSKTYTGVKLYRDDIDLILSLFHEYEYTTYISDNEFEFESLNELIDKRGVAPTYFYIKGKDEEHESVSISFEKNRLTINSYSDVKKVAIIIFSQIRDIIESRISKIYIILNPGFYISIIIVVFLFLIALLSLSKERAISMYSLLLPLFALPVLATIISGVYRDNIHRVVILKRKHEGGFWKQNADKIWLLILGGLIGVFIKFILEIVWKAI